MNVALTALFPLSHSPLSFQDIKALGGEGDALAKNGSDRPVWIDDLNGDIPWEKTNDTMGSTLFAGWINPGRDAPQQSNSQSGSLQVAEAFAQHGDAACHVVGGEWLWIRWDAQSRCVTLAASQNRPLPLYYAWDGKMVAICSSLRRIARLPSLSGRFDTEGFLGSMARARFREATGDRSHVEGVFVLHPGSVVVFGPGKARSVRCAKPREALPKWTGSFEDAVARTRGLLKEITVEHLARHKRSAVLLSGGLDSSTLAWLLAEHCDDPTKHIALSSAAAPGSGLADETHHAEEVARALGLPFERVVPAAQASPYRPSNETFSLLEGPSLSQRHYLYDAFYKAAAQNGANAILDGAFGELSLTSKQGLPLHLSPLRHMRRAVANLRRRTPSEGIQDLFHVRMIKQRFTEIDQSVHRTGRDAKDAAWAKPALLRLDTPIPNLWHSTPFRDRRLLELVATMPHVFHVTRAQNRRLGRAVLERCIPDHIRLRRSGMPFSPDYEARLRLHAAPAIGRITDFRLAGADEWIDLDWLHGALSRIGRGEITSPRERLQAQLTAMAGEFFVWWRQG
jgi:asparagine synthase (glutamine-hydrolysing)